MEKCTFTLSGFKYRGPESYSHKELPEFARTVAIQISSRLETRDEWAVSVVGQGFADGIHNSGTRRRDELSKECQERLKGRPGVTMNDADLATTRECYVSQAIRHQLGGAVHISWKTALPYDEKDYGRQGPAERKVDIVVYAATEGGC